MTQALEMYPSAHKTLIIETVKAVKNERKSKESRD